MGQVRHCIDGVFTGINLDPYLLLIAEFAYVLPHILLALYELSCYLITAKGRVLESKLQIGRFDLNEFCTHGGLELRLNSRRTNLNEGNRPQLVQDLLGLLSATTIQAGLDSYRTEVAVSVWVTLV